MCASVLRVVVLCLALVWGAQARCARRMGGRAEGPLGGQGGRATMIRMLKRSDMAGGNREDQMARILYRTVGSEETNENKVARILASIYGTDEDLQDPETRGMKRGARIRLLKRMGGAEDGMCG